MSERPNLSGAATFDGSFRSDAIASPTLTTGAPGGGREGSRKASSSGGGVAGGGSFSTGAVDDLLGMGSSNTSGGSCVGDGTVPSAAAVDFLAALVPLGAADLAFFLLIAW